MCIHLDLLYYFIFHDKMKQLSFLFQFIAVYNLKTFRSESVTEKKIYVY